MALPSAGVPLSLNDIKAEFGGATNHIPISDYYGVAEGVPSSGEISINNFYGKSAIKYITDVGSISSSSTLNILNFYLDSGDDDGNVTVTLAPLTTTPKTAAIFRVTWDRNGTTRLREIQGTFRLTNLFTSSQISTADVGKAVAFPVVNYQWFRSGGESFDQVYTNFSGSISGSYGRLENGGTSGAVPNVGEFRSTLLAANNGSVEFSGRAYWFSSNGTFLDGAAELNFNFSGMYIV